MKKRYLSFIVFILTLSVGYSQLPSGFNSVQVQDGYINASGTIFTNNGLKMFVWETRGKVYVSVWNGASYVKQTTPVVDISEEVGDWRDFGLLSMCLDPNFDTNGYIYLFYTVDRHHLLYHGTGSYDSNANEYYEASVSRLARYTVNASGTITANPSSRLVLLGESINNSGPAILHESHGGGTVLFGDDGSLLVSTGDGASYASTDLGSDDDTYFQQALNDGLIRSEENVGALRSQMINSFNGKVLRLDPATGDGLSSNPFYDAGNPRSAESRMYAMGLRNPFRMSILKGSGSTNPTDGNPGLLFVSDVGWGTWEDMHIIDVRGLNAGWPLYEGQTKLNNYFNSGVLNQDEAGNPTFASLCSGPTSHAVDPVDTNRRFTHSRPGFAYHHFGSTQVRVPWFSGTTPTEPRITDAGSPTTGVEFQGNAITGSLYFTSGRYGAAYQNKLFFTDFAASFIRTGDFNPSGAPWFTDIGEFAPDNHGQQILHVSFNPLDEFIYYTNNVGTIFKIEADETLAVSEVSLDEFKVFPNPATDYLTIEGISGETNVEIFDIKGRRVQSASMLDNRQIPLKLPSGLYVLQISTQEAVQTKKLIIN